MANTEVSQVTRTDEKIEELKRKITPVFEKGFGAERLRETCFIYIVQELTEGAALDPRDSGRILRISEFYRFVHNCFSQKRLEEVAVRLFIQMWEVYQSIQRDENVLVYGDVIAGNLSDTYEIRGDFGAAMRWALSLAACELLRERDLSSSVRSRLLEWYELPENALEYLRNIGLYNRKLVIEADNWVIPEAFAEDVITKFLAAHQEYGMLFARHTPVFNEFPLSTVYFESLLNRVQSAQSAAEKGKALEDLATYLTLLIPGWIPRRNVKTVYNEFESDIIVSNLVQAGNLNAELFGRNFLIECKNWNVPVGVPEVGYFLYRMRLTHTSFGILFAANGITGENQTKEDQMKVRKAAESMRHRAFNEDGIVCIVITSDDLDQIQAGQSFWAMIVEKARAIQYGENKYKPHN